MTEITFTCPRCGGYLSIDRSVLGMAVCCPHCAEQVAVPAPSSKRPGPVLGLLSLLATIGAGGVCYFLASQAQEQEDPRRFLLGAAGLLLSMVVGGVMALFSLRRGEKPAIWAWLGFFVILLPLVAALFFLFRGYVISQ